MTIERIYKSRMTSNFLTDSLGSGVIPTIDEISNFVKNINLTGLPLLKNRIVPYSGAASATQFSGDIEALSIDVNAVYDYINEIVTMNNNLSNYLIGKLLMYKRTLRDIIDDIDALLLVTPDTAGFNDYYYEPFDSINNIDFSISDGYVDKSHSLYKQGLSDKEVLVNVMKSNVKISFGNISNVISSFDRTGFEVGNLVDRTPRQWQREVTLSSPVPLTAHIYIDFPRVVNGINKIDIDYGSSSGDEAVAIAHTDGSGTYTGIDIGAVYSVLGANGGSFSINEISNARGVRIDVLKRKYDYVNTSGNYVYLFALDEISIYANGKKASDVTIYQSDPIVIKDNGGNNKIIKACSLYGCDNIPIGTNIDYMVYGYDSGSPPASVSRNDFINISNIKALNKEFTTVVTLGDGNTVFPSANVNTGITGEWSVNLNNKVFDKNISSIQKQGLYVWTNPLSYSSPPFDTGNTGWDINGGLHSCVFLVDEDSGITIDLKTSSATMDGKLQTGKIFLTKGVHSFSTASNWRNNTSVSNFSDSTEPVPNHKYLIEGVQDKTIADTYGYQYRSAKRTVGAKRLAYIPKHDFLYGNVNDIGDFFTTVRSSTALGDEFILLSDKSGIINSILVEYNSENSSVDTLLVRAIMYSNGTGASPSIDSILVNLNTANK